MPTFVPPKKNAAYTFYVGLISQADTKIFKASPTLAAGDVKVAVDDGAPANLATLPVVDADFTKRVKVDLSAAEMNGDNVTVIFADAAGAEWCDLVVNIQTTVRQVDDLAYPAVSGRSLAVDASGRVDVGAVAGSAQTAGDIIGDTNDIQARLPAVLVGGRMAANAEVVGDKTGYGLSAAAVQAIWDALTSALTTAGSIGKHLVDRIVGTLATGTHQPQSGDGFARLGAPAGASVSADIAAVKAQTGEIETDTQNLQSRLPTTLSAAGNLKADIKEVNDVALQGVGTAADPWRPA